MKLFSSKSERLKTWTEPRARPLPIDKIMCGILYVLYGIVHPTAILVFFLTEQPSSRQITTINNTVFDVETKDVKLYISRPAKEDRINIIPCINRLFLNNEWHKMLTEMGKSTRIRTNAKCHCYYATIEITPIHHKLKRFP